MKSEHIKKIAVIGLFSAIAFVLMLLDFSVPFLVPSFVKFDFSDFPPLVVSFMFGPLEGIVVCLVKNLFHLAVSSSGGIGGIVNFLIGAAFVGTAGLIFKKKPTFGGSIIACAVGTVVSAIVAFPANMYITYPFYSRVFCPMEDIIGMYQKIIPSVDTLPKALLYLNTPFTLLKGISVSVLNLVCYKKLNKLMNIIGCKK